MGNCLVTKLKESVSNANLLKLGEMRMKVTSLNAASYMYIATEGVSSTINLSFNKEIQYRLGDTEQPLQTGTSISAGGNIFIYFINGDTEVSILNKYNVVLIQSNASASSIEFAGFDALDNMMNFYCDCDSYNANIDSMPNVNYVSGRQMMGNIEKLQNTAITMLDIGNENVIGNVEIALSDKVNLTACVLARCNVTGHWENVFNAWAIAGKVTSTDGMLISTGYANFNGSNEFREIRVRFGAGMVNPTAEDTARGWQWEPWFA